MSSALVSLLLILVVIGIIVWAVNKFIPMDERIRQLFNVVAIILAVYLVIATLVPDLRIW